METAGDRLCCRWRIAGIDQKSQCGVGVAFGDVNNDQKLDVVYGQHCGGPVVYLGDGTGQWTNHSQGLQSEGVNAVALGDLDNDNQPELVTIGATLDEGFRVYKLDTLWQEVSTNLPDTLNSTPLDMSIQDVDEDGLQDILHPHLVCSCHHRRNT